MSMGLYVIHCRQKVHNFSGRSLMHRRDVSKKKYSVTTQTINRSNVRFHCVADDFQGPASNGNYVDAKRNNERKDFSVPPVMCNQIDLYEIRAGTHHRFCLKLLRGYWQGYVRKIIKHTGSNSFLGRRGWD
ncbi:hypothetical protein L208DRAFT_81803 [Tricholoma matsutake]|nr:hypothetical protein L208DRAFT_81803 [Tricholoma matsutake 945]